MVTPLLPQRRPRPIAFMDISLIRQTRISEQMGHGNVGLVIALLTGGKLVGGNLQINNSRNSPGPWPESGKIPNTKDKLEFAIHDLVCDQGTMTVAAARAIFLGDWTKAYKGYVR